MPQYGGAVSVFKLSGCYTPAEMMAVDIVGIVVSLLLTVVALVLIVALPILSILRVSRAQADVARLTRRLAAVERELARRAPLEEPRPIEEPVADAPASPLSIPLVTEENVEALERRIGGRLMLYAGMIVLLLGVSFFLIYAFENEWMSPAARVGLGGVLGFTLIVVGRRLAAGDYRAYGLFLSGGGIAVLYLSVYAALGFYGLLDRGPAFVLLVAITMLAAVLADREASLPLALMAVCGGFLTPFLVGGREDAQLTLFSYDALLVAATMYLARRRAGSPPRGLRAVGCREWPWLNLVSLALTAFTVTGWAERFYTPDRYLATELFLTLYCAMFLAILRENVRSAHPDARVVSAALLLAPAAYHVASVVILFPHGVAFPVYLIAVTVVSVLLSIRFDVPVVRLITWIIVALPLSFWIEEHRSQSWIVGSVTTVIAIAVVHLLAQIRIARQGNELAIADVALIHGNGVGMFGGLFEAWLHVFQPWQMASTAAALAVVNGGVSAWMWRVNQSAALHWLGVALSLLAIAVAVQLDGPWALVMWAAEGAAAVWIASRTGREWVRAGGWILLGVAVVRWLRPDLQETSTAFVPLLNARALSGLFVIGVLYAIAWVQRGERDAQRVARRRERAAVLVGASALTLMLISAEIVSYWQVRETTAPQAELARQVMLSAAWAAYAALLIVVGMRRHYAPIRYFAIVLFALTVGKVFIVDLGTLGGIYRVAGFLVVGSILLLVSFLYQRARLGQESP